MNTAKKFSGNFNYFCKGTVVPLWNISMVQYSCGGVVREEVYSEVKAADRDRIGWFLNEFITAPRVCGRLKLRVSVEKEHCYVGGKGRGCELVAVSIRLEVLKVV